MAINPSNPSVTVIVPVYNVSEYIEKCARSIFEQTLEDLEILFIDDCSLDDSVQIVEKILDDYPQRKNQTKIIRMSQNTGIAGVRRQGIVEATGDYIIQCDGDDWVDVDYFKTLYDCAVAADADIVVGHEIMEYPNKVVPKSIPTLNASGKIIMKNWYGNTVGMFCHNKLVKRSLFIDNDIFPWAGLNMWEDNGLFARLFYYAENIVQVHGPVYHYNRCNVRAMTAGYGEKQVNQMIGVAKHLTDFFLSKPDYKDFEKTVWAFQYLAKINLITDSFKNYRRFRNLFTESDAIVGELDPKAFSTNGRLRFLFVKSGFAPLFILAFKLKNLLSSVNVL